MFFSNKFSIFIVERLSSVVMLRNGKEIRFRFGSSEDKGWQGSKTQAYWLVVRVLLTPPAAAAAAASQKWKIIYLQVLSLKTGQGFFERLA